MMKSAKLITGIAVGIVIVLTTIAVIVMIAVSMKAEDGTINFWH